MTNASIIQFENGKDNLEYEEDEKRKNSKNVSIMYVRMY